jgi:hypothetical protein
MHCTWYLVKRVLNAVAVVDVNVQVQQPLEAAAQVQARQHAVVHEAEPLGFVRLAVVPPAAPVDRHVALFAGQPVGRLGR